MLAVCVKQCYYQYVCAVKTLCSDSDTGINVVAAMSVCRRSSPGDPMPHHHGDEGAVQVKRSVTGTIKMETGNSKFYSKVLFVHYLCSFIFMWQQ